MNLRFRIARRRERGGNSSGSSNSSGAEKRHDLAADGIFITRLGNARLLADTIGHRRGCLNARELETISETTLAELVRTIASESSSREREREKERMNVERREGERERENSIPPSLDAVSSPEGTRRRL